MIRQAHHHLECVKVPIATLRKMDETEDETEDDLDLNFTNNLSIKYQRYIAFSRHSLWDIVQELISFVSEKYQHNPNLNSIQELEKITIRNEQGSITPEQAVFNILDKHFEGIKKERLKRKAEAEELKAMLLIRTASKRARTHQAQTVFEGGAAAGSSDVGTSASHAASGSSS